MIVGINVYKGSGLDDLSFCAADAEAFYDALITYAGYEISDVLLFSDTSHKDASRPDRSDILDGIQRMCNDATDQDSILFFFAGHGTRDEKDSFLLTSAYRSSVVTDTSIPMETVNNYFLSSAAKFKLRFFDACHSGRMGKRAALLSPKIERHFLVEAEGWATISACKEDQFAHEDPDLGHGIFSYLLIKGLEGSAATEEGVITLDSLRLYVVEKTLELTRALGLEQTPVLDGVQAGVLVLAKVENTGSVILTEALERVKDSDADQLKPTASKIPAIAESVRSIFEKDEPSSTYFADTQAEKLEKGDSIVGFMAVWAETQITSVQGFLSDLAELTFTRGPIRDCPLNLALAEYLKDSKIRDAIEWEFNYRSDRVNQPYSSLLYASQLSQPPQTVSVLTGVSERRNYYQSSVTIWIRPERRLYPICSMVLSIVPSTFGLYQLCYFGSTDLGREMKEYWSPKTFSLRLLSAIPSVTIDNDYLDPMLNSLFAQFISFFL